MSVHTDGAQVPTSLVHRRYAFPLIALDAVLLDVLEATDVVATADVQVTAQTGHSDAPEKIRTVV